ncbi:unnamed protein product, partial [Adineta steineri]
SQDTHSKKVITNDNRNETLTTRTTTPTTQARSTVVRAQQVNRIPQTRCNADQTVFKIQKGVRTFDLCTEKNVLITGGMDRVLRIWNPYLPSRPIARLRGHSAPIFLVKISAEDNRIFSISTDKAVLVS